jgi:hypothetical protein
VASQVTLGLSQKAFGTTLFFVLQLTFIGAATGLSFYNHSELDSRIKALSRLFRRKNRVIARIRKQMAISPANRIDEIKGKVQRKALVQQYELMISRYNILVAVYQRFNILNQKNKVDQLNPGLVAPALPSFDEDKAVEWLDTGFDAADNIEEEMPYKPNVPGHLIRSSAGVEEAPTTAATGE